MLPCCLAGLLLLTSLAAAQEEGAPGQWRGRQLTTPPAPPPVVAAPLAAQPPPTAAVVPGATPWTPPPPSPTPPSPQEPVVVPPPPARPPLPPAGERGIARVPVEPEWAMPAPPPPRERAPEDAAGPDGIRPRRAFSYNAYALDFGQLELGIGQVALGLAPRVQVGTNPVLDGLGAWNLAVRANVLRAGPVDVSPTVAGYRITDPGGFEAGWLKVGLQTSIIATPRWSLHLGGSWDWLAADGIPQVETLRPFLWSDEAVAEAEAWAARAESVDADLRVRQVLATVRVATDIRLTWRDSLVLQASALPFGESYQQLEGTVQGQRVGMPPILQLDDLLVDTGRGDPSAAIRDSYVVSLAYQASWEHLQLRLGVGSSATDLAWLLPSFDLAWRFGGWDASKGATPAD